MAKTLAELDRMFKLDQAFGAKNQEDTAEGDMSVADEPAEESSADELEESTFVPCIRSLAELDAQFGVQVKGKEKEKASVAAVDMPIASKRKRVFSTISDMVFYSVMVVIVIVAFFTTRGDGQFLPGNYRMYNVMTSSMISVYPPGSMLIIKEVDPNELVVGNDITFYRDATTTITHRIEGILENHNDSGHRSFITKGVDNNSQDRDSVPAASVVGKVVFFMPGLGAFFQRMQSNQHLIIIFFVVGVAFSLFLNMTLGETLRERKIRKARAVLRKTTS